MKIRIITFSDRGERIAEKLCRTLMKSDDADFMRCGETITLPEWTAESFGISDALIFVGACGIAVRAVAPFVESKASDPAVIVVDELGKYAIPILSGHLGGANDLDRRVAGILSAEAVITTATDINGVFAIDEWARYQDCAVVGVDRIKDISSRLLSGGLVSIKSNFPIMGETPQGVVLVSDENADVHVTTRREPAGSSRGFASEKKEPLVIVPRIAVLGIGCRRGTEASSIEKCFEKAVSELSIYDEAFYRVCSIDLKKNEPGLLEFCKAHELPFITYSSKELSRVPGEFSASGFVEEITGVDNVCERSAVLGADDGRLVMKKLAWEGVTMAVAFSTVSLDWTWRG